MPSTIQSTQSKTGQEIVKLKRFNFQDGVNALELAENTLSQFEALFNAIENTKNPTEKEQLARIGAVQSEDMANYFNCAHADLQGAQL